MSTDAAGSVSNCHPRPRTVMHRLAWNGFKPESQMPAGESAESGLCGDGYTRRAKLRPPHSVIVVRVEGVQKKPEVFDEVLPEASSASKMPVPANRNGHRNNQAGRFTMCDGCRPRSATTAPVRLRYSAK